MLIIVIIKNRVYILFFYCGIYNKMDCDSTSRLPIAENNDPSGTPTSQTDNRKLVAEKTSRLIVVPECENIFLVYSSLIRGQEWTCSHLVYYWHAGDLVTKVWTCNQIRGWFIRENLPVPEHFQIDSENHSNE